MAIAVLGAGLIGSAAARHLALAGQDVTLIGPDEPPDWGAHGGVFASHYDEGRITRRLDAMPFWARVSSASIDRYAALEAHSGVSFHTSVGGLYATRDTRRVTETAERAGIKFSRLVPAQGLEFGYHIPSTVRLLHEGGQAGYVSPRRLVEAQQRAALKLGAKRIKATVREAKAGQVKTDAGSFEFDQVLWAAGGFGAPHLELPLRVEARTVALLEVSREEAARRANMPTLILADGRVIDIYLLPPIRYPDGKWYFKIGGGPHDRRLRTEAEMTAWYQSGGDHRAADSLTAIFQTLVPDAVVMGARMAPCVTTYTPDELPAIGRLDEVTCVATGGNGRGAKCSDELGRLGARALLGDIDASLGPERFNRS